MENKRGEVTREDVNASIDGVAPPEPKTTPGDGKPEGDKTVETPPVEPPVAPPEGEEPPPTDDKGKSGEPEDDSELGRKAKEGTPKGVQKKIDKVIKQRGAAERKAVIAEGKVELLEKQLKEAKDVPLPELVVPKEDDFDDFDKYTDALADHKVAVRDRKADEKAEELEKVNTKPEPKTPELTDEQEEVREAMVDSLGEMREKHEDFDEVAFGKDAEGKHTFPVTEFMKEGMESSESRMGILYYLGSNTAEAVKIAALPPTKQVMAIAKLDAKLKGSTKKIQTPGAPPPITPAGGSGISTTEDLSQLSTDEWIRKRNTKTGRGRRAGRQFLGNKE